MNLQSSMTLSNLKKKKKKDENNEQPLGDLWELIKLLFKSLRKQKWDKKYWRK